MVSNIGYGLTRYTLSLQPNFEIGSLDMNGVSGAEWQTSIKLEEYDDESTISDDSVSFAEVNQIIIKAEGMHLLVNMGNHTPHYLSTYLRPVMWRKERIFRNQEAGT